MSAKPTEKQQQILDLMADGYNLVVVGSLDPWSYVIKYGPGKVDQIRVRSDSAFHLLRKDMIREAGRDFGRTTYKLKEPKE